MAGRHKSSSGRADHGRVEDSQEMNFLDILTKEEKEDLLNKKMEEIRRKNEALQKRHALIEADRRAAELKGQAVSLKSPVEDDTPQYTERPHKNGDDRSPRSPHGDDRGPRSSHGEDRSPRSQPPRNRQANSTRQDHHGNKSQRPEHTREYESPGKRECRPDDDRQEGSSRRPEHSNMKGVTGAEDRPSKFAAGRGKRLSQMSQQTLKAQDYEKSRKKPPPDQQNVPPPDPGYKFLSDRSREGNDPEPTPRQQEPTKSSARHPRNYGGSSFENVKSKIKLDHDKQQTRFRSGPPSSEMEMSIHMTGKERRDYTQWRSERDQIDKARVERQKNQEGIWTREWDLDKKAQSNRPPSPPASKKMEPGRRPAGKIGSGRFVSVELEDKPKVTRDDSVNIREKDGRQNQRVRPVSWGGPELRDNLIQEAHVPAPARRGRMSSQSSEEGQRYVQEQNDLITIKIENDFVKSPTSPTEPGRRRGSPSSRAGFGGPSNRTSATRGRSDPDVLPHHDTSPRSAGTSHAGSGRFGSSPRRGEHTRERGRDLGRGERRRGRGSSRHHDNYTEHDNVDLRSEGRGRARGGRGLRRGGSDAERRDSHSDDSHGFRGHTRGEGRGRPRGRGESRRGHKQDRPSKVKTVTFQAQPIVHDVEMEWDHGTDINSATHDSDSQSGSREDFVLPSEENWDESEMNAGAWNMEQSHSDGEYIEDDYTESPTAEQPGGVGNEAAQNDQKQVAPSHEHSLPAAENAHGYVDENGDPIEDDDQEWEDTGDEGEEEDDDPHDSSAESLERFIQEHTLRVDVCAKTGNISLEGSGPSSQHTSSSGHSSQTATSPDYLKTPTGHVKVLDWGAEVDAYLETPIAPAAEDAALSGNTTPQDPADGEASDASLNVSLNSTQSLLDSPHKDGAPSPKQTDSSSTPMECSESVTTETSSDLNVQGNSQNIIEMEEKILEGSDICAESDAQVDSVEEGSSTDCGAIQPVTDLGSQEVTKSTEDTVTDPGSGITQSLSEQSQDLTPSQIDTEDVEKSHSNKTITPQELDSDQENPQLETKSETQPLDCSESLDVSGKVTPEDIDSTVSTRDNIDPSQVDENAKADGGVEDVEPSTLQETLGSDPNSETKNEQLKEIDASPEKQVDLQNSSNGSEETAALAEDSDTKLSSSNTGTQQPCSSDRVTMVTASTDEPSASDVQPGVSDRIPSNIEGEICLTEDSHMDHRNSEDSSPSIGQDVLPPVAESTASEAKSTASEAESKPQGTESEPSEAESKPQGTESEPSEAESKPQGTESEPSEAESKAQGTESEPSEAESKAQGTESEPSEAESKPQGTESEPSGTESKPLETEFKPSGLESEPSGTESKPLEVETETVGMNSSEERITGDISQPEQTEAEVVS